MGDEHLAIGKRVFLSYKNDDDRVINGYVTLLEVNGFVKFRTKDNIISIPVDRVLKIKEEII
jgi:sporulation protein YlmC with PRC-barrel domain